MWWADDFVEINGRNPPGLIFVCRDGDEWLARVEVTGLQPFEFTVEAGNMVEAMRAAARETREIVPHLLFDRSPN